ncbi:hypothetical protein FACS189435_2130 [Bacteroidia bacterium]|nr:hypothetical protein FACS189435_2130 [Bacteroidia bacterium]
MALEIKRAPVLRGKAAEDFYKTWENMSTKESAEDVQANVRKVRKYLATQKLWK